jgi:hypothetical protein
MLDRNRYYKKSREPYKNLTLGSELVLVLKYDSSEIVIKVHLSIHLSHLLFSIPTIQTQKSQSQGFGMAPEEFQKNFEKSLNISEKKVNITSARKASERMMRFMTQDADVVKFMTDMKFDYKDLHMVNNYFNKSS